MPTRKQRNSQIEPSELSADSDTSDPLADAPSSDDTTESEHTSKGNEEWDVLSSTSSPGFKIGWPSKPNAGTYHERAKQAEKLNMTAFRLLSPVTFDNAQVDVRLGEVGFLPGDEVKLLLKKGRVSVDEEAIKAGINQLKLRTG